MSSNRLVAFSGPISYHSLCHHLQFKYKRPFFPTRTWFQHPSLPFLFLQGAEKPCVWASLPSSWCPSLSTLALPAYLSERLTPSTAITHRRCKLFNAEPGTTIVKTEQMIQRKGYETGKVIRQVQPTCCHTIIKTTERGKRREFCSLRPRSSVNTKASLRESRVISLGIICKV